MIKIKLIKQKHIYGCPIACISMVLNKNYDDIIKHFYNDFNKQGIILDHTTKYIMDNGPFRGLLSKKVFYNPKPKCYSNLLLAPYADAHIIRIIPYFDQIDHGHIIVMDSEGKLYDPRGKRPKNFDDYYEVDEVAGFLL